MRRGITLIEMLIATGLLVAVGLVILALFKWGFESTAHGQMRVEVQQKARLVLERMSRELSQAALLPAVPGITRTGQSESSEAPSPVLLPSPSLSADRRWTGSSTNHIVFAVAEMRTGSQSVGTARLDDYSLVEYQVLGTQRADGTAPGPLVRRVYKAFASTSPVAYNAAINPLTWALSPAQLSNVIMNGDGSTQTVVETVPFPESDGIRFTVAHNADARSTFSSSLFELTVQIVQYPRGQSKRERKEAVEQTTVSARGSGS